MQIKTLLISLFLTWTAIDLNLFRRRGEGLASSHVAEVGLAPADEEVRQKKQIRQLHRENIVPPWLRDPPRPVRTKVNYFKSRPRDVRLLDQRKIRRRINNM